jgi:hypothetical protein
MSFLDEDSAMQPLSKVRPDFVNISFGQDVPLAREPKIAIQVAECIAKWADAESLLGFLLGLLLGADAKGVLAMYASVENRAAQMRMITAAAKEKLEPAHFAIFEALMVKIIRPAMRERDKLAHWCWGFLPEVPGMLLLMEPDEKTMMHYLHYSPPRVVVFDKSKVFVVKEGDINRILRRLIGATDQLVLFTTAVKDPGATQNQLLEKLRREPRIREFLDRRKESQETHP